MSTSTTSSLPASTVAISAGDPIEIRCARADEAMMAESARVKSFILMLGKSSRGQGCAQCCPNPDVKPLYPRGVY